MKFLRVFVSPWLRQRPSVVPPLCKHCRRGCGHGWRSKVGPIGRIETDAYAARQTFVFPVPVGPAHRRAPSPGDNDEKPLHTALIWGNPGVTTHLPYEGEVGTSVALADSNPE